MNNMFQFKYRFNGPPDQGILIKNRGNNAQLDSKMAMPQKFYPSAGDSMFSNSRRNYIKDSGGGTILNGNFDSSQYIQLKKINAIGKSSTRNISKQNPLAFSGVDKSYKATRLQRTRSQGCVAPKKKTAIANPYKSGGGSVLTGTGNRSTYGNNNF